MALKINCISLGLRDVFLSCCCAFHPAAAPPGCWKRWVPCPFGCWLTESQSQKVLALLRCQRFWGDYGLLHEDLHLASPACVWCSCSPQVSFFPSLFFFCKLNVARPHPFMWQTLVAASSSIYPNPIPASLLTAFAAKPSDVFLSYLRPVSPLLLSSLSWPWVEVAY